MSRFKANCPPDKKTTSGDLSLEQLANRNRNVLLLEVTFSHKNHHGKPGWFFLEILPVLANLDYNIMTDALPTAA